MLIGICGYAQSGKDTVCGILQHHGVIQERYAFADPIKVMINALFGWDERHAFGELKEVDTKVETGSLEFVLFMELVEHYGLDKFGMSAQDILSALLLEIDAVQNKFIDISPRKVYQKFGTEVAREQIRDDIWTIIAPTTNVCIPDVRFPNEAAWVSENQGTILKVVKNDATPVNPHVSESHIESLNADFEVDNNGSLADLETQLMEMFGISETAPRLYSNAGNVGSNPLEILQHRVAQLQDVTNIQLEPGTWDYDPYFHGMANGLLLAMAIMQGNESVEFREAPEQWIADVEDLPSGSQITRGIACNFGEGCPNGVCDCGDVPPEMAELIAADKAAKSNEPGAGIADYD